MATAASDVSPVRSHGMAAEGCSVQTADVFSVAPESGFAVARRLNRDSRKTARRTGDTNTYRRDLP